MSKIIWDEAGKHFYETGVSHGVLYTMKDDGSYNNGVAWNGLTSVSESPEGAEVTKLYADNIPYLSLMSIEEFKATIEAYTYPDEFGECDGSIQPTQGLSFTQQARRKFALCYRTEVGNDVTPADPGKDFALVEQGEGSSTVVTSNGAHFKLHIIYGCLASPSEKSYETVNDSPEAATFSWEIDTTPVAVAGYRAVAHVEIDSKAADPEKFAALLDTLYGTNGSGSSSTGTEPTLVLPADLITALTPGN